MIPIGTNETAFLYEIMEDYKAAGTQEEKDDIFGAFCASLWSSANKRRIYNKSIRFRVPDHLLQTPAGQVFAAWSEVGYKRHKSRTKEDDWPSILRQKINNLYTRYFDKEVILDREYMDLLKTPKRLYYEWISGIDTDAGTVSELIEEAMNQAEKVKFRLQQEKMFLPWNDYKKIVEGFLRTGFENCRLIGEYEDTSGFMSSFDFFTEDHFYTAYLCRTLENRFRNYQKACYHVRRGHGNRYCRCIRCGALVEKTNNRVKYCKDCYNQINRENAALRMKRFRSRNAARTP